MKAFHLFLCICSAHIHAFLSYQTSLTKHKIQDKNKNTKMVIAECKTEKGGQSGGVLWLQGSHAHKSSRSSSLWGFLSHLPSEDKSKAAPAGQIVKCARRGLRPTPLQRWPKWFPPTLGSSLWEHSLFAISLVISYEFIHFLKARAISSFTLESTTWLHFIIA